MQNSEDRQKVQVNLRRPQASFLSNLAHLTGQDPGEICGRLILLAADKGSDWRKDPLFSEHVQAAIQQTPRVQPGRHWIEVDIPLDQASLDLLDSIAEETSSSRSRALRHLITDAMKKSGVRSRRRRRRRSRSWQMRLPLFKSPVFLGVLACLALAIILLLALRESSPTQSGPNWAGQKASLVLDPHTHTDYSDGELSPGELVAMAVKEGCDALVISDHSDSLGTVSEGQIRTLKKLRERYPELLLFNGIELNMPSYVGREHATIIAGPSVSGSTLRELRDLAEQRNDPWETDSAELGGDMPLLRRIADQQDRLADLLLIYSHPARKDLDIRENFQDLSKWNAQGRVFTALEGAPGHQNAQVAGSYEPPLFTMDRWDPVVAEINGVWDQLLSHGHDIWGALASSDYHDARRDKPPCAFSRTHLVVPEKNYRGVLAALRNGTFWADHGRILDQLKFALHIEGMEPENAYPGTTVYLNSGGEKEALLTLAVERGPGSKGKPLLAEIIGSCRQGSAEKLAELRIPPGATTVTQSMPLLQVGADGKSCTVRARVRLEREGTTDYLAYTNHIRLMLN